MTKKKTENEKKTPKRMAAFCELTEELKEIIQQAIASWIVRMLCVGDSSKSELTICTGLSKGTCANLVRNHSVNTLTLMFMHISDVCGVNVNVLTALQMIAECSEAGMDIILKPVSPDYKPAPDEKKVLEHQRKR